MFSSNQLVFTRQITLLFMMKRFSNLLSERPLAPDLTSSRLKASYEVSCTEFSEFPRRDLQYRLSTRRLQFQLSLASKTQPELLFQF